jgi:hypothetical protein
MKRVLFAIGVGLYLAVLTEAAAEKPMSPIYRNDPRSQSAGQPNGVSRKPTNSAPAATAEPAATADIPPLAPAAPRQTAVTETAPKDDSATSSHEQRARRQTQHVRRQSPAYYRYPAYRARSIGGYSDWPRGSHREVYGPSPNGGSTD